MVSNYILAFLCAFGLRAKLIESADGRIGCETFVVVGQVVDACFATQLR
jgi:hypothetical protein